MADLISSQGFYVVAPDFLHNDPVSETLTPEKRTAWMKKHAPVRIPGMARGGGFEKGWGTDYEFYMICVSHDSNNLI